MIDLLHGKLASQHEGHWVVLSGGIGFHVAVPEHLVQPVGSSVELYTYFHWSADLGPQLFGFATQDQKEVFSLVISSAGIGPRMGLALLSAFSPAQLLNALIQGNIALLSSVSGVGKKKAETMVVSLKDKAAKLALSGAPEALSGDNSLSAHFKDLSEALGSLGYSRAEIGISLEKLASEPNLTGLPFDLLLRKALQALVKRG